MTTTTYCEDSDILAEWPKAGDDLNGGSSDFDTVRVLVSADIESQLASRSTPIEPSELTDPDELLKCEVYGVLAKLFMRAHSTPDDAYWKLRTYYNDQYNAELLKPLSVADEVRKVGFSMRVRRGG